MNLALQIIYQLLTAFLVVSIGLNAYEEKKKTDIVSSAMVLIILLLRLLLIK